MGRDGDKENLKMGYILNALGRTKLPTVATVAALLVATAMSWYWVWGVFFLYWAIAGIVMRQTFVVQIVRREESPALFWFISIMWLALAALSIAGDLFPTIFPWATG